MLNQRAAPSHIDNLTAQADAEDRQTTLIGLMEDRKVVPCPAIADGDRLRVRRLAVEARRDIGTTADQQAIEAIDLSADQFRVLDVCQRDRQATRRKDGIDIPHVEAQTLIHPPRRTDQVVDATGHADPRYID